MRKVYKVKNEHGKITTKKGLLRQTENNLYYFHNDYMKACLFGWYVPVYDEEHDDTLVYRTFVSKYYLAT
jgi:hypothetical protein